MTITYSNTPATMIIDHTERTVSNSNSPIQFTLPKSENSSWPYWYRYLEINGKKAFETGNICGTCNGFFRRLPGEKKYNIAIAQQLSESLNTGLNSLNTHILQQAEMLVPNGEYYVFLKNIKPQICKSGNEIDFFHHELTNKERMHPNNPNTFYFRLPSLKYTSAFIYDLSIPTYNMKYEKKTHMLLESLVPLISYELLDNSRIDYYRKKLRSGETPTVFALGIWDKLTCLNNDTIDMYDFLANYIIDGHHKAYAAALENKSISLLTYVKKDNLVNERIIDLDLIQAIVNQK